VLLLLLPVLQGFVDAAVAVDDDGFELRICAQVGLHGDGYGEGALTFVGLPAVLPPPPIDRQKMKNVAEQLLFRSVQIVHVVDRR
jgi:hypothetical protein